MITYLTVAACFREAFEDSQSLVGSALGGGVGSPVSGGSSVGDDVPAAPGVGSSVGEGIVASKDGDLFVGEGVVAPGSV
jgi:hypothetical protein